MREGTAVSEFEAIRRWPSREAKEWVRAFLRAAWDDDRIRVVVAIGSAVRPVETSLDVDLVVAYDAEAPPATPSVPIDVDLRYFPVAKLRHLALTGNDLVGWAVRFGSPILDKGGRWRELVEDIGDEIEPPPPAVALARAERARRLLEQLVAVGDEDAAHEQLVAYLTHLARAVLAARGVYPASRPELPQQLRDVGEHGLAGALEDAIAGGGSPVDALAAFGVEAGGSQRPS